MTSTETIFFQVNSDLNNLEFVLSQFESVKQCWIPTKPWLECQLALAEAFTNAVRHAHCNQPIDTLIDIEILVNETAIVIKIWDYGQPFDLIQAINVKVNSDCPPDPFNLSIGGRGLTIINKVADKLSYDRLEDDRNCLMIYKTIS